MAESCLHYLLPDKCDSSIVNKLRHSETFHLLTAKTERFKVPLYHIVLSIINNSLCFIMLVLRPLLLALLFSHRHLDI